MSEEVSKETYDIIDHEKIIAEEEAKFQKETQARLDKEEAERSKLQKDSDMKDKLEHEAELAADEDAHKTEMEAKEKDYEAIEAAKEAANARKAAE